MHTDNESPLSAYDALQAFEAARKQERELGKKRASAFDQFLASSDRPRVCEVSHYERLERLEVGRYLSEAQASTLALARLEVG